MLKRLHSTTPARKHALACHALKHRRSPSEPERRLWQELSAGKLGVAFRRQVVVGNAIADFFAPCLRLVVEVDGVQHRQRRTADARRDRDLRRLGCEVLRIDAQVVMQDLPRAVALVARSIVWVVRSFSYAVRSRARRQ
jgi:very-short-patch-repair endonuclease